MEQKRCYVGTLTTQQAILTLKFWRKSIEKCKNTSTFSEFQLFLLDVEKTSKNPCRNLDVELVSKNQMCPLGMQTQKKHFVPSVTDVTRSEVIQICVNIIIICDLPYKPGKKLQVQVSHLTFTLAESISAINRSST